MPLPYRWLTALMVRYNGSSLLIDCGEGTQIAIKEKGWSFKPIDVICFTHYHGDHISGLPGLLLTMGNADRTEPLTLVGPRGLERVVNALRVIAPELPFPIKYVEITEPEQTFEMNGYRLKAFRVNHNVLCYGYTMEVDRAGKFDVERATAAQIPQRYWGVLQKGETVEAEGPCGSCYERKKRGTCRNSENPQRIFRPLGTAALSGGGCGLPGPSRGQWGGRKGAGGV